MTTAADRRGRGLAAAATAAFHLALVAVWLWWPLPVVPTPSAERGMAVFDVPLPPMPPPPERAVAARAQNGGGSQAARHASVRTAIAAPAIALPIVASPIASPAVREPMPDAISLAPLAGLGADSGGGDGGVGTGRGGGDGDGTGRTLRARHARWLYRPTIAAMRPYWPEAALAAKIGGSVALRCIVPRPGRPERCSAVSETPPDMGFGAAAERASVLFRIDPVRIDGRIARDVPILLTVVFHYRPDKPAGKTAAPP